MTKGVSGALTDNPILTKAQLASNSRLFFNIDACFKRYGFSKMKSVRAVRPSGVAFVDFSALSGLKPLCSPAATAA
jgi:hypothetical protein